jgi:SAM-dependent MidA family methyltransferase
MIEIRREIERCGPVSFARFMGLALYHPEQGYYRRPRDPFGAAGDYFTSSQLQPVFGRLIARQIAEWREELGADGFTVVELGSGRGETAQVVREVLPGMRYVEVEAGRGEMPASFRGVALANEFFDALPVHVARFDGGRWRERRVGVSGECFCWVEADLGEPELESYLRRYVPQPAEGQVAEAGLEALRWIDRLAGALERGYVLILDYGYTTRELIRFPAGSLLSYRGHRALEDVLAQPGERDITAHVAFDALRDRAESCGLRAEPLRSQAQFLLAAGEQDGFTSALAAPTEAEAGRLRGLLKILLYGMGETFRVLILRK